MNVRFQPMLPEADHGELHSLPVHSIPRAAG